MASELFNSLVVIATGIIGLAIIAVLVSRNANTSGVIGAAAKGFSSTIAAAVSPVSGGGGLGVSIGSPTFY
jgi:hypothetical protein